MSSYTGYLVETLVTLLAVCALAVLVLWGGRRLGLGRPSGPLALRGHLPLDARRAVYLVQVGEHVFVIGVSETGFTKLGELPAGELPAGTSERVRPFGDVLAGVLARARPRPSGVDPAGGEGTPR